MERKLYVGVDLHSTNGVYQVVDEDRNDVWHGRLANDPDTVMKAMEPFKEDIAMIAIESTYNWYWLGDTFDDAGYPVILANPAAMDQYRGLKNVDDYSEAAFIAHLLALDILPGGWICPPEQRNVRDLLRRRLLLVHSRTCQILSLQAMLMRETGRRWKFSKIRAMSEQDLRELLGSATLILIAKQQLELIAFHSDKIKVLEDAALAECRPRPEFSLLTTIPGVGKILAMTIMLEIGTIDRFPKCGNLSSYARTVRADRISNGKRKGENNRRNGNSNLAWAFIEAANHMIRCCPQASRWHSRKVARTKPVVARKALASKLSKAVWYMLKENKPFNTGKIFG